MSTGNRNSSMGIFTLYTGPNCGFCALMKKKLNDYGMVYNEINIREDNDAREFLRAKGHRTIPVLYMGDTHVNTIDTAKITKSFLEPHYK